MPSGRRGTFPVNGDLHSVRALRRDCSAGLLVVLGTLVALVGLVTDGPRIEKYKVRGPVLVIAAILGFAAMIRPVGLVIASYVTFMVAILGSREMRVLESIIAAAVMTAFCVFLFTYLLNLPFQLWPRF